MESIEYPLHLVNQNVCPECNGILHQINTHGHFAFKNLLSCTDCNESFKYNFSDRCRPRMFKIIFNNPHEILDKKIFL